MRRRGRLPSLVAKAISLCSRRNSKARCMIVIQVYSGNPYLPFWCFHSLSLAPVVTPLLLCSYKFLLYSNCPEPSALPFYTCAK